jgi:hypothetical protein
MRKSQRTLDNFVEQYLAWIDTMSAKSHFRWPVFSADGIANWTATSEPNKVRDWSFDVFPRPVEHFDTIHEIVELYKPQPDPHHLPVEVLEKVLFCKDLILSRPIYPERERIGSISQKHIDSPLLYTCYVCSIAAMVLMRLCS